tara:strand:- start:1020 stop:1406 length:387 start_codon:yes stop_codon:yes gene_type:complete
MLSKLFLTLAIIFLVALILKRRPSQESGVQGAEASAKVGGERPKLSEHRLAAYLFLAIMFGLGGVVSVQKWRDDHTVVTIKLYSAGESVPTQYQAFKFELDSRSFTTVDGVQVVVANDERMELSGLDQ